MARTLEFYFDYGSPYSYLADTQVEIIAKRAGAGLDPQKFGNRIQEADVKDRLKAVTEEAVARGVFGAPTCFVDGKMFFGNDRLPFVEMALKGELP